MTSIHDDPVSNGQQFGCVLITVDLEAGDCNYVVDDKSGVTRGGPKHVRLHSLEEIRGAYGVHYSRSHKCPVSANIAAALRFAASQIKGAGHV